VVVFRAAVHHVPIGQVKTILDMYAEFPKQDVVFILRLYLAGPNGGNRIPPKAVIRRIDGEFDIIEKAEYEGNEVRTSGCLGRGRRWRRAGYNEEAVIRECKLSQRLSFIFMESSG
jgi:hypothetical protein